MLTKLSVNLNKIALLRNAREGNTPSVTLFGAVALKAGAAGLTVHPRPDERHIRASDVPALSKLIASWPGREFNIEGNPFRNLMDHVRSVRPHQATTALTLKPTASVCGPSLPKPRAWAAA